MNLKGECIERMGFMEKLDMIFFEIQYRLFCLRVSVLNPSQGFV